MTGLLSGYRVLEVGSLGAACGRFLATLGADVVKAEPAGGDPARRTAQGGISYEWIARNLGKLSVVVEPAQLRELAGRADFVIDDLPAARRAALGLDHASLSAANPAVIGVSITPFGSEGPYADWAANELICSAMGGTLRVTGYEDRAPVKEAGDACVFHANGAAAAGAMFALVERSRSGRGQQVDVSIQETTASRCTNGILAWQFDRRFLTRTGVHISYGAAKVRCIWELKDGWCFHALMSGRIGAPANAALSAWMDELGLDNPLRDVDWLAYNRSTLPADVRAVWERAIDAFFRSRTKAEIAEEGRRRGINAVAANAPADILGDPHLAARGFFDKAEAEGRKFVAPAAFVRAGEIAPATEPPQIGEHTEAVLGQWRARSAPRREPTPRTAGPALAGVKVLDFSWALVGSFTTKNLADYGAQVVKVESSTRPCLSRIDVQVGVSKPGQFDDKPWFIHMNTSKQGLRINMKHPRWREVIEPLVDWADIVVENFSPGTMASLGLDYERLKARKPDIIMLSGSVYGQTGPLAREWGVDGTGAALSGRLHLTGWPDRPPVTPSAVPYGDVVLPPYMAAAAAAALDHRRRTGEGVHIDASMYEVCVQQMAGAMLQAQLDGAPERLGNHAPEALFQGVFPTAGEDRWIAIAADGPAPLQRLAEELGEPAPQDLAAFEAKVAAWTAPQEAWGLMARLQAAGVAAGVVQDAAELVDRDPQLAARGFLVPADNPVLGPFAHQGQPYKLSRTPARITTAPGLGQHNETICREIVGLSPEAYAELAAAKLFE